MARRRPWRLLAALAAGGTLAGVGGVGLLVGTARGRDLLLDAGLGVVNAVLPEAHVEVGRLRVYPRGLGLEQVTLSTPDGRPLVEVERVVLLWIPRELLAGRVHVTSLVLERPRVTVARGPDDRWDLLVALGLGSEDDEAGGAWEGLPVDLRVDRARIVEGTATVDRGTDRWEATEVDVGLSVVGAGRTLAVERVLAGMALRNAVPGGDVPRFEDRVAVAGSVRFEDGNLAFAPVRSRIGGAGLEVTGAVDDVEAHPSLALSARTWGLEPAAFVGLVGETGLVGPLALSADLVGPVDDLGGRVTLDCPGGVATLDLRGDAQAGSPTWTGDLSLVGFDVGALVPAVREATVLTGTVHATGAGILWPGDLRIEASIRLGPGPLWGVPVDGALATAVLEAGAVRVRHLGVRTDLGQLGGSGTLDLGTLVGGADLSLDGLPLAGLSRFGLPGARGTGDLVAHVDLVPGPEGVDLAFQGTAGVRQGAWQDVAGFGVARVPLAGTWTTKGLSLRGTLDVSAVEVSPLGVAHATGPWSMDVDREGVVAWSARPVLAGARLGDLGLQRVVATLEGTVGAGAPQVTSAVLSAEDVGFQGVHASEVTARVRLEGDALTGEVRAREGEREILFTQVACALGSGALSAWPLRIDLQDDVRWEAVRPVVLGVGPQGIQGLDARLESDPGDPETAILWARGDFDPAGPVDLHLEVRDVTLDPLVPLLPMLPRDLAGRTRLVAHVGGTAEDLALEGSASVRRLRVPGYVDGLDARASFATVPAGIALHLEVPVPAGEGDKPVPAGPRGPGDVLVVADAVLPVRLRLPRPVVAMDAPWSADLVFGPGSLARWERVLAGLDLPDLDASGRVRVGGTPAHTEVHAAGAAEIPLGEEGRRIRVDADLRQVGEEVRLEALLFQDMERQASLSGVAATRLPEVVQGLVARFAGGEGGGGAGAAPPDPGDVATWVDRLEVDVVPQGIDTGTLRRFLPVPPGISASLLGGVHVSGHPLHPRIAGGLQLVDARVGDLVASPAWILAEDVGDGLQVQAMLGFGDAGGVEASGFVPMRLDLDAASSVAPGDGTRPAPGFLTQEGLELQVAGAGIPLQVISTVLPEVAFAEGLLHVGGTARGSLARPEVALDLALTGGAVGLRTTGVRYDDLVLDAHIDEEAITLGQLSAVTRPLRGRGDGGPLRLAGRVGLAGWSPTRVDLTATAEGAWFTDLNVARVRGGVALTARGAWPAVRIAGDATVTEARVTADEAMRLTTGALAMDPSIVVHRVRGDSRVEEEEPPFYQDFSAHVAVSLPPRSTQVLAQVPLDDTFGALYASLATISLDALLGGDVVVGFEDGAMDLEGSLETWLGQAEILGADFDLEEGGTISFTGGDPMNPILDVKAVHRSSGYGDVDVAITGPLETMTPTFSSERYPDLTDIVSILALGRPLSELSGEEGQSNSQLLSVAAGAVMGQLERALGGSFFDMVQIDAAESGLGTVRVGRSIGRDVFVVLALKPQADVEANENVTEATLEWTISRAWVVGVVTGDQGTSSADVFWTWRF